MQSAPIARKGRSLPLARLTTTHRNPFVQWAAGTCTEAQLQGSSTAASASVTAINRCSLVGLVQLHIPQQASALPCRVAQTHRSAATKVWLLRNRRLPTMRPGFRARAIACGDGQLLSPLNHPKNDIADNNIDLALAPARPVEIRGYYHHQAQAWIDVNSLTVISSRHERGREPGRRRHPP